MKQGKGIRVAKHIRIHKGNGGDDNRRRERTRERGDGASHHHYEHIQRAVSRVG